ncbi:hypothetical protein [Flavobacterium sp. JP2137]|uniref:hypothetical protein n=1 Tax=Flavobacterium sp. JP2137 TaxID=3414510 RepID=UPI003D2FF3AC
MKPFLALILLVFVFKPVLPIAGFVVNYDYIKNELCENKDRPELHCNGRCYLKKELAKSLGETDLLSVVSNSTAFPFQLLYFPATTDFALALPSLFPIDKKPNTPPQSRYHFDGIFSIFRPPASPVLK